MRIIACALILTGITVAIQGPLAAVPDRTYTRENGYWNGPNRWWGRWDNSWQEGAQRHSGYYGDTAYYYQPYYYAPPPAYDVHYESDEEQSTSD
jgi:hypothetical protein